MYAVKTALAALCGALFPMAAAARAPTPARLADVYARICTGPAPASAATCAGMWKDLQGRQAIEGGGAASAPIVDRQAQQRGPAPPSASSPWWGMALASPPGSAVGAEVSLVHPLGPAAAAGLLPFDLIVAAGGRTASSPQVLRDQLAAVAMGGTVPLTVVRDGKKRKVQLTLAPPPVAVRTPEPAARFLAAISGKTWTSIVGPEGIGSVAKFTWEPAQGALTLNSYAPGMTSENDAYTVLFPTGPNGEFSGYFVIRTTRSALPTSAVVSGNEIVFAPLTVGGFTRESSGFRRLGRADKLEGWGQSQGVRQAVELTALDGAALAARQAELNASGGAVLAGIKSKVAAEFAAKEDAKRQAERQRSADRSAFWGGLAQGLAASVPVLTGQDGGGSALASLPAMRADGSAPNLLDTLNGVNAQLQRQNAEGKARLDVTIAQAQAQAQGSHLRQQPATTGAPSSPARSVAAPKATPPTGAGTRTVRMVLWAGMVPTEPDINPASGWGRNPNCQSNIITATIRRDDQSVLPEQELFERHRANFVAKCERMGTLTGAPTYVVETPGSSRFGEYGWNDRRVTLP